jgi:peptidoglycan hydrolase-like protein with peptidoglycan-binding domain
VVLKLDFAYPADPTVYKDGLPRMLRIWEASRDANTNGYGSGTVFSVFGSRASKITSCSPFTGTCIGMMFDSGSGEAVSTKFKPKYHGNHQLELPSAFYALHNGYYFTDGAIGAQRLATFKKNGWPTSVPDNAGKPRGASDQSSMTSLSFEFFNLGYRIDPRDMRRGDFIAISWTNGHGHATFCWDVHKDDTGAVDAFLYLSANGNIVNGKSVGVGVSVSTLPGKAYQSKFITESGGSYTKVQQLFKDDDKYTELGCWLCVPPKRRQDIDLKTFNPTPAWKAKSFLDCGPGFGPQSLEVYRFWGFEPPDSPHGKVLTSDNHDLAMQLARGGPQPDPKPKTGTPPDGRIPNVTTTPVPKSHPDPKSVPPPKPAAQPKAQVLPHQSYVEGALAELHDKGWIDKTPGKDDAVHDAATRDAVKDFQAKFKSGPVDGIPGPITRSALKQAIADLHAGKPNPNGPAPKPNIDRFYWVGNRVAPGGTATISIEGLALDIVQAFELVLKDPASGKTQTVQLPRVNNSARGTLDVVIPQIFAIGAAIVGELTATSSAGKAKQSSKVPLHVGTLDPPSGDWPWDQKLWSQTMRDIYSDLAGTPAGTGPFDRYEITQFGVKEKLASGDVEVKSKSGQVFGTIALRSLMLADIEGTMRLNNRILNITQSGNVYEPKEVMVDGKKVIKKKPNAAKFDPNKSLWVDVTVQKPWGAGARMPLIPYRTLAINPSVNSSLYNKKVYIKQLDGLTMAGTNEKHNGICIVGDAGGMRKTHFDLFVGREDHHISIKSVGTGDATICEIQVLGDSPASHKRG